MTKGHELSETQSTEVALNNQPKRGLEEAVDRDDLIIPRAKLLQALSPEISDDAFKHLALKEGVIINSLTKKALPANFLPIVRFVNWIRFNPRDKKSDAFDPAYKPGQLIWQSNDPHDERVIKQGGFGPNGEKPLATKFINFISYFPGSGMDMPVIISFSSTSFKAGKELTSFVRFTPGDIFSRKYKLFARKEKNDMGTFYVFGVEQLGEKDCIPSPAEFKMAEMWYNDLSRRVGEIKIHDQEQPESELAPKSAQSQEW